MPSSTRVAGSGASPGAERFRRGSSLRGEPVQPGLEARGHRPPEGNGKVDGPRNHLQPKGQRLRFGGTDVFLAKALDALFALTATPSVTTNQPLAAALSATTSLSLAAALSGTTNQPLAAAPSATTSLSLAAALSGTTSLVAAGSGTTTLP